MAPTTVVKNIKEGKILIDFGSYQDSRPFEGRTEQLPLSLLDGRTETREIKAFPVIVPERTLLLFFKLKAAWDRSYQIGKGSSIDEEWEKGKLRKDRADILSLIDPDVGGTEIDIHYLGERFNEFPFLAEMLREISEDLDTIRWYGKMDQKTAQDSIEKLLLLALEETK